MIYVCIPSYNEAPTVGLLLWKVRQVFASFPREYQLLVLDDGSTDATAEVLERYTRVLPLTVLRHDERRGYAASVDRLFRQAVELTDRPKRDAAILMHADFAHSPQAIPDLVRRIESGADLVVGEARLEGEAAAGQRRGSRASRREPTGWCAATVRSCFAASSASPGCATSSQVTRSCGWSCCATRSEARAPACSRARGGPPMPSCTGAPSVTPVGWKPFRLSSATTCGRGRAACRRVIRRWSCGGPERDSAPPRSPRRPTFPLTRASARPRRCPHDPARRAAAHPPAERARAAGAGLPVRGR